MKTAIEWFFEQLEKDNHLTENEFLRIIQQAKEMEREFLILAHINGQSEFDKGSYREEIINNAKQYYNETFKSE
jgi:hypothetical protein